MLRRSRPPRVARMIRTPAIRAAGAVAVWALCAGALVAAPARAQEMPPAAEIQRPAVSAFAFEHTLTLPVTPERLYDVLTGDISGWWDHNLSGDPARFYIEPWPGGRFMEVFDDGSRDGALFATVLVAKRPELLIFKGPLGLVGNAIEGVYTYRLEPVGSDSTQLTLATRMVGEMQPGWPEVVERVWRHFLFEGLQPYIERGGYLEPGG